MRCGWSKLVPAVCNLGLQLSEKFRRSRSTEHTRGQYCGEGQCDVDVRRKQAGQAVVAPDQEIGQAPDSAARPGDLHLGVNTGRADLRGPTWKQFADQVEVGDAQQRVDVIDQGVPCEIAPAERAAVSAQV